MAAKNTRHCIERKKSDNEKEKNCRRRIRSFLGLIGYECSTEPVTLREEAVRKLNEIEKRKGNREVSNHSEIDAAGGDCNSYEGCDPCKAIGNDDAILGNSMSSGVIILKPTTVET